MCFVQKAEEFQKEAKRKITETKKERLPEECSGASGKRCLPKASDCKEMNTSADGTQ